MSATWSQMRQLWLVLLPESLPSSAIDQVGKATGIALHRLEAAHIIFVRVLSNEMLNEFPGRGAAEDGRLHSDHLNESAQCRFDPPQLETITKPRQ